MNREAVDLGVYCEESLVIATLFETRAESNRERRCNDNPETHALR